MFRNKLRPDWHGEPDELDRFAIEELFMQENLDFSEEIKNWWRREVEE